MKTKTELLALVDRVTAERDALQQRLTAAYERADVLGSAAKEALEELLEMKRAVGFRGQTLTVVEMLEAALKPAEGGVDER